MGRELRMVPPGWEHPKNDGGYVPLLHGFKKDASDFDEGRERWDRGEVRDYVNGEWRPKYASALECGSYEEWAGRKPDPADYMPDWPASEATMYVMYENTSEGTPISPAFHTAEELARWLHESGASWFGPMKATGEQWLGLIRGDMLGIYGISVYDDGCEEHPV